MPKGRLSIHNIQFGYQGDRHQVLNSISHNFVSGAVTVVTGQSGRGKSTLLYLLGLLLTPNQGVVRIDDITVSSLDDRERSLVRAALIGMVFQDSALDASRTLVDCVTEPALYARRNRRTLAAHAIELMTSLDVNVPPNRKPGQISGGQAQRVAIARALVNDPRIILADEPTGNLDPGNAQRVWRILKSLASEGRTVVVATHSPELIADADEVIAL